MCNSYELLPALLQLTHSGIGENEWLTLLGEHWSSFDNISDNLDELMLSPFGNAEGALNEMMTQDEREVLSNFPEEFFVYRGCYESNKFGLSWSLDRAVAEKFPSYHRYKQDGQALLVQAKVKKCDVVALKIDRGESEIVVMYLQHLTTSHI